MKPTSAMMNQDVDEMMKETKKLKDTGRKQYSEEEMKKAAKDSAKESSVKAKRPITRPKTTAELVSEMRKQ